MKIPKLIGSLITAAVFYGLGWSASAALVTVTNTEVWDGTSNPHEADGVTLSGGGTSFLDPFIYTIPAEGMLIKAGGTIVMSTNLDRSIASPDASIQFQFQAPGSLTMEAGGVIDTQRPMRGGEPWGPAGRQNFNLDLAGGDVLGAGTIKGLRVAGGAYNSRHLVIVNVRNVNFGAIDLHSDNINSTHASVFIEASGAVNVAGKVDASDKEGAGGSTGGNVEIKAEAIAVGGVDTTTLRTDGNASSGSITLQALSAAGFYQTAAVNDFTNRLILSGPVTTLSPAGSGGNITLQSVALQLNGGASVAKQASGTLTVSAGDTTIPSPGGTPQSLLFVNIAGASLTPTFDVNWNGVPPAGSAPSFTAHPINGPAAAPGVPYNFTPTATDPNGGTLTYSKGSGPAWLSVAANGAVSGTPATSDSGVNVFRVAVTDGTRFDITTLNITVGGPPTFNTSPIVKAKASQDVAYTGQTLAGSATDYDGDPITFAKVSGPAWLSIAASGALSGTPTASDTFTNTWVVAASDGTGTNTATLQILVGGGPKFLASPIVKPDGAANVNYSIASQTLAVNAADPDGDPLTFSKVSGPAWLTVAANGALAGTPGAGDVGNNAWTVQVADATRSATATLQIKVSPPGPITISSVEVWDGVANPHAGQGVTLSGSGTDADPCVYTIPGPMRITSTGQIQMSPDGNTNKNAIKFVVAGDLQMDDGGILNTEFYNDRNTKKQFTLDLSGTNSITGSGRVVGITAHSSTPRVLTIENVVNVSFASIDLHVQNPNTSSRHALITASGAVVIPGKFDNSDQDPGGNNGSDVTIKASTIQVGSIDTSINRTGSADNSNGKIALYALSPDGSYDLNAAANNTISNKVHVTGSLQTKGRALSIAGGNVTVQGTVLLFGPGASITTPDPATPIALDAGGVPQGGATAADVFKNYAGLALTPNYDVQWSGTFTPPANVPTFTTKPMTRPDATDGDAYSATLAGSVTGGVGPLMYARTTFGPAWLRVAANGALSGTPTPADIGTDVFHINVTDGTSYDTNVLTIVVKSNSAPGAIQVAALEVWDGVANPHAADGVVLTGDGSRTNPAVYTIPGSLRVRSTGEIQLDPPLAGPGAHSNSIVFFFTSGNLIMDAGAKINTADHNRQYAGSWPLPLFIITGNGTNDITGAGNIVGLQVNTDTPRLLTISNMNNVTISNIDLHVENVNNGNRALNIRANGHVDILNVNNTDVDTGGSDAGPVNIYGSSVTVGTISTENWRTSGGNSGNVNLRALSPQGGYDRTAGDYNWWPANKLTVNGLISTWKLGTPNKGNGLITLQGTQVELGPDFMVRQPPTNSSGAVQATLTVDAGVLAPGLTANHMLINNSAVTSSDRNFFLFDTLWSTTLQVVSRGPAGLTLAWSDAGTALQKNTDLGNPNGWSNVPGGAVSPITLPTTNAATYFRLKFQ